MLSNEGLCQSNNNESNSAIFVADSAFSESELELLASMSENNVLGKVLAPNGFSEFIREDSLIDFRGNLHFQYRQLFKGLRVDGTKLHVHFKDNRPYSWNGLYVKSLSVDTIAIVTPDQALSKALVCFRPISRFTWEATEYELSRFGLAFDSSVKVKPSPEKVVWQGTSPLEWKCAYSVMAISIEPFSAKQIFVDVRNGEILEVREQLYAHDVPGRAVTKYAGIQPIICDRISPGLYTLFESDVRRDSILVLNAKGSFPFRYFNADTNWNLVNGEKDEVAADILFGLEKSYDYFRFKFGRLGYDNKGHFVAGVAHHSGATEAFWLTTGYAYFGDGDNTSMDALTCLDVVAHEYVHGITKSTSDLRYDRESGALNESFSDIFGKCVEYTALPDSFSWEFARQIMLNGTPSFRNFSDPNSRQHPKYYRGLYYDDTTSSDGYGVHTNSSVQNYWFHLLCEGGSGIREADGKPFRVRAIGLDTAAMIAYYTLTTRLVPTSKFIDAANGSIAVGTLLFGGSSDIVKQVIAAWYAVGVLNTTKIVDPKTKPDPSPRVYPNPTNRFCSIKCDNISHHLELRLVNVLGICHPFTFVPNASDEISLDLGDLWPGVYFLKIVDINGTQHVVKIVRE